MFHDMKCNPRAIPGTSDQAIAAGYHDGSGYVQGDADLAPGNIKEGIDIFGDNYI